MGAVAGDGASEIIGIWRKKTEGILGRGVSRGSGYSGRIVAHLIWARLRVNKAQPIVRISKVGFATNSIKLSRR